MINVKITMVDGSEYNVRNYADSITEFYKRVFAPYGTNVLFLEILPGVIICSGNVVSMREMSEEEVSGISETEEIVGWAETKVEVEESEENLEIEETEESDKSEEPKESDKSEEPKESE
jgi:hypothetical protein